MIIQDCNYNLGYNYIICTKSCNFLLNSSFLKLKDVSFFRSFLFDKLFWGSKLPMNSGSLSYTMVPESNVFETSVNCIVCKFLYQESICVNLNQSIKHLNSTFQYHRPSQSACPHKRNADKKNRRIFSKNLHLNAFRGYNSWLNWFEVLFYTEINFKSLKLSGKRCRVGS